MKEGVSQNFSMGWPLVKSLLWALLLFVQIHEHRACIEEERTGLLELKAFLKSHTNYTKPLLPTWVYEIKGECCSWERVNCSTTTGHVINLTLSDINDEHYGYSLKGTWFLNVSLLQPFKELRILDLSGNGISGWLGNEEPVNLSNLEVLNLRGNHLNGSMLFKGMVNFGSLKILDLSYNSFTGSIPPYIGALSSLKAISLYHNQLNGTLAIREMCALMKLEELDLGRNNFAGILPPCLTNLTSLRWLDISNNRFSGNLSLSLVASWTSLEYIDLSYNLFEGLFSLSLFANHSKLKGIQISSTNNKLVIETENHSWDPSFQLKVLVLSNCSLNKPTSNIPKFLFDQHELEIVDISHNKLNGSFPIWLLENNTRLQMLSLRRNSFVGQFHLPSYRSMDLRWLDVSNNNLDGQLQENIGKIIPKLEYLNLSQNYFVGDLPSSIGDMSNLKKLDLSFNNFSEEVPMELVANCTSLDILRLSNNNFHGEIFSKHLNLSLTSLELNNNYFTGTLPVVRLRVWYLDISNNHMSGIIPEWMVNNNMTNPLIVVDVSNNFFEGQIPCGLGPFYMINLSHNLLSGLLPACLNLSFVNHLLLQGNNLTGSLPKFVLNSYLVTLDIRDNSFFGNIPEEINRLSELRILLLSGNHFSGMIPKQLCQLKKIGIMDLSVNFFSGTIASCFHNITFGKLAASDFVYIYDDVFWDDGFLLPYHFLLKRDIEIQGTGFVFKNQIEIEFVTKNRSNLYKDSILDIMSGLDLSFNNLIGEIPPELGQLSSIHGLNLSYNQLTGHIPKTFSNLTQLESLDLSHNNFSGEIPSELTDLTFLAFFTVAHNNLSGKVPDMKKQFSTFGESNYEGNPFLCGPPLKKSCIVIDESPPSPQNSSEASDGKWYEVGLLPFFTSFWVSYIIFFLGVVSVLYINPHWRKRCFNLVEDRMYWCYYFALNTLKGLTSRMRH